MQEQSNAYTGYWLFFETCNLKLVPCPFSLYLRFIVFIMF